VIKDDKKVLQFLAIQRNKEWAIPGGVVFKNL
jgi:hypothetical protein